MVRNYCIVLQFRIGMQFISNTDMLLGLFREKTETFAHRILVLHGDCFRFFIMKSNLFYFLFNSSIAWNESVL
jgi:hypothetical protein